MDKFFLRVDTKIDTQITNKIPIEKIKLFFVKGIFITSSVTKISAKSIQLIPRNTNDFSNEILVIESIPAPAKMLSPNETRKIKLLGLLDEIMGKLRW